MSTIRVQCGNCPGTVEFDSTVKDGESRKCRSCKEYVIYESPREVIKVAIADPVRLIKQQAFTQAALNTATDPQSKATLYVSLGMIAMASNAWANAQEKFTLAKSESPADPEISYYLAMAQIQGKRPRALTKSEVTSVLDNLNYAIGLNPLAGKYYYLKALVIKNFYTEQSMAYSEKFMDVLNIARAFGVTQEDIDEIFSLIKMTKPAGF